MKTLVQTREGKTKKMVHLGKSNPKQVFLMLRMIQPATKLETTPTSESHQPGKESWSHHFGEKVTEEGYDWDFT